MKAIFTIRPLRMAALSLAVSFVAFVGGSTAAVPDSGAGPAKVGAPPIEFRVAVEPKEAGPGETIKLTITGIPKPGFHTYPVTQRTPETDKGMLTELTFEANPAVQPVWTPFSESPPQLEKDSNGKPIWALEHEFRWSFDLLIKEKAQPGAQPVKLRVRGQVCDSSKCVPLRVPLETTVTVTAKAPVPISPALQERLKADAPPVMVVAADGKVVTDGSGKTQGVDSGLIAFILAGVFWGAMSLITPCVFPMIPITVSFFLKQSEKEHHRPVVMALVYSGTIVIVLTIAAVTLLSFFRWLSVHPAMNFGLGLLFIFFALSLLGMYEIELPSGLARFTSSREGRGGLVGTMFMALTFTIISFACVAPFLGGFGGTADTAQLSLPHRILGGLAFSATFASPFLVLALFPALMKKMPKSGSWLNSVKVVMGFLELGAALVFLRTAELVVFDHPVLFTYDFVLGMFIALSLLCGLYLLNVYRLPHDSPAETIGVPRVLFSLAFLGLAFYLLPALFKDAKGANQRPRGAVFAWLDSFLLPESHKSDLPWIGNLEQGLADAREKPGGLVFVDFTGITCKNCRLNESNVFPKPEIEDLLKQYVLVQLYTDRVPNELYPPEERAQLVGVSRQKDDADANLKFQRESFGDEQLPLYVILEPQAQGGFKEVARYDEGKINNEAAFMEFLTKPLAQRAALRKQTPAPVAAKPPIAASKPLISKAILPRNLSQALEDAAKKPNGYVFVDFTGVTCVNCKINEKKVFPMPEVQELLGQYSLVKLYVDKVPEEEYSPEERAELARDPEKQTRDADANLKLEAETFGDAAQPLYVILQPEGDAGARELARFSGRITDVAAFVDFLKKPLQGDKSTRAQAEPK